MRAAQERLEYIWEMLLSREPIRIMDAFESLPSDQRSAVLEHLEKMVREPGWQPGQRISAQAALGVIPEEKADFNAREILSFAVEVNDIRGKIPKHLMQKCGC